jgi:hypothetical protein
MSEVCFKGFCDVSAYPLLRTYVQKSIFLQINSMNLNVSLLCAAQLESC